MAFLAAVLASLTLATSLAHAESRATHAPLSRAHTHSATVAAAALHTIRISGGTITRIGAYRPHRDPTIAGAERVFGPSSRRQPSRHGDCRVYWQRLRPRIVFETLGGTEPGQTTCAGTLGQAQWVRVRGRAFRTWKGLRVGQRSSPIPHRHPSARSINHSWWLKTARIERRGFEDPYPVAEAIVSEGRVTIITGWIGAAGNYV